MSAQEIKDIRHCLGLTAKELSEQIGVTENTVNRWEMGIRSPSGAAIKLLRLIYEAKQAVPA